MARSIIGYNVYRSPEGSGQEFYGFAKTLAEARGLVAGGRRLEESLWDTARAAGHCHGIKAPEGEEAADAVWLTRSDNAVAVYEPLP